MPSHLREGREEKPAITFSFCDTNTGTLCDTRLKSSILIRFLAQQVCELPLHPFSFWHFPSASGLTPSLQSYAILITLAISVPSSCIPLYSKEPTSPFAFFIFAICCHSSLCTWFVCQAPSQTRCESFLPLTGLILSFAPCQTQGFFTHEI